MKIDEDNDYFFYDKTNNRIGIGLNTGLTAKLNFVAGTAASGGINFGADVVLYRWAADNLKTDDTFEVGANIKIPNTTSSGANGVIYKSGTRFLHAYGYNIFLGQGAGNFTTSGGSGSNIGIGTNSMVSLTSGQFNIVIGTNNGQGITTASNNTFLGLQAGRYPTGSDNTAVGANAMYGVISVTTSTDNVAVGKDSSYSLTTGSRNTVVGTRTALGMTTGNNNVFVGYHVGDENGVTGTDNIIIGYDLDLPTTGTNNYISIGNTIYGNSSTGQVSIRHPAFPCGHTTLLWRRRSYGVSTLIVKGRVCSRPRAAARLE